MVVPTTSDVSRCCTDDATAIFHGEVINTRAVITFQGVAVEELHREMAESIEDYLAWCKERGKEPEGCVGAERAG